MPRSGYAHVSSIDQDLTIQLEKLKAAACQVIRSENRTLSAVRGDGRISLMGVLTGFSGNVDTAAILRKRITLQGIYVGSVATLAALSRTKIKPVVDRLFGFDEAEAAYKTLSAASHFGKLVVRVAN